MYQILINSDIRRDTQHTFNTNSIENPGKPMNPSSLYSKSSSNRSISTPPPSPLI